MTNSSYCIRPQFLILRDAPHHTPSLLNLFQDSHTLFRIRVQKLGSLSKITTREESDALRIMLEALIATKETLQNQV